MNTLSSIVGSFSAKGMTTKVVRNGAEMQRRQRRWRWLNPRRSTTRRVASLSVSPGGEMRCEGGWGKRGKGWRGEVRG